jgi:DNA-binding MarR family transcriptional regulator
MAEETPESLQFDALALHADNPENPVFSDKQRITVAQAWTRASSLRRSALGISYFQDPAWDILLLVYLEHLKGRALNVTAACTAGNVAPTTGLRWLQKLTEDGWVERRTQARNRKCVLVILTDQALVRMNALMEAVIQSDNKFGLQRMSIAD